MLRPLILASFVATAACDGATDPEFNATVSVGSAAIVASISAADNAGNRWLSFEVPLTITNHGSTTLQLVPGCAYDVEGLSGGVWSTAWSPYCALINMTGPTNIQPGATLTINATVRGTVNGTGGPKWNGQALPGTYRIRIAFGPVGDEEPIPHAASNSFTLSVNE